jgi:tellurite methyltransferase
MKLIQKDLNNFSINEKYDCIISSFTFHLLKDKNVSKLLAQMLKQTNTGGFNFIEAFIKTDNSPEDFETLFEINELKILYENNNWQIIEYKAYQTYLSRDTQRTSPQTAILLIARKIL